MMCRSSSSFRTVRIMITVSREPKILRICIYIHSARYLDSLFISSLWRSADRRFRHIAFSYRSADFGASRQRRDNKECVPSIIVCARVHVIQRNSVLIHAAIWSAALRRSQEICRLPLSSSRPRRSRNAQPMPPRSGGRAYGTSLRQIIQSRAGTS
jgi:hypothetical protein